MVRITTQCGMGDGTITIEVEDNDPRVTSDEPVTAYGTAVKAIQEANRVYEENGDHFEYLCKVQFAMNQCSVAMYNSLRKIAKYM